jgi:hypothetical protein
LNLTNILNPVAPTFKYDRQQPNYFGLRVCYRGRIEKIKDVIFLLGIKTKKMHIIFYSTHDMTTDDSAKGCTGDVVELFYT